LYCSFHSKMSQIPTAVVDDPDWRSSGHPFIGHRVARRSEDGLVSFGPVTYWLPPTVADPFVDASGKAAPLFKITFTEGDLVGDSEDLELNDVSECLVVDVNNVNDERDEEDDSDDDRDFGEARKRKKPSSATRNAARNDVDMEELNRIILEEYQAAPARGNRSSYPKARRYVQRCLKGSNKREVSAIVRAALNRARYARQNEQRRRKRAEAAVPAPAVASMPVGGEGSPPRPPVEDSKLYDPAPGGDRGRSAAPGESRAANERGGVDEPPAPTNASVGVVVENDCVTSPPLSTRAAPRSEEIAAQEAPQPPTAIAEEGTLSREVEGVLLRLGLTSYRQHFSNYGAETMDDLLFLTEADCVDMEIKPLKRRRLLSFLHDTRHASTQV